MKKSEIRSQKSEVAAAMFILFLPITLLSQSARDTGKYTFSLQQAIDFAMKNEANVLNAVYDEQIAKHKVKETIGIGLPQIGGNIGATYFAEIPTSVIPASAFVPGAPADMLMAVQFGTPHNATAALEASQLIFNSSYLVGLQASRTFLELSRKAAQRTRIETSVSVSKAYYTVLLNEERMKLLDANVARLKKLLDDTQVLNNNGFVEKLDLDRITVAYNNLLTEKEKVQRLMSLGNSLLKFQIGMDQQAQLSLTDKLADIKFTPPADPGKFDYGSRVEYSLLLTQKTLAQLNLKRHRLSYLPSAVVFGSASANSFRNQFDYFDTKLGWYPTVLFGARINVGIFDGLQTHHRVQQSKLEVLKAENSLKMLEQGIDLELSSAKAGLLNASVSLDIQKKNMDLAESIFKASKLKYEQGVGSSLEVMDAETGLKEAQTNYFSALYDALISKVEYEKANGSIK